MNPTVVIGAAGPGGLRSAVLQAGSVLPDGFALPPLPYVAVLLVGLITVGSLLWTLSPPINNATVVALTPWMITGGVLAWARAVSEFGAVAVVAYSVKFFYPPAGGRVTAQHAPVFVYNTYLQGGLEESGAVAFLLLSVSAVIFLIVRYLTADTTTTGGVV